MIPLRPPRGRCATCRRTPPPSGCFASKGEEADGCCWSRRGFAAALAPETNRPGRFQPGPRSSRKSLLLLLRRGGGGRCRFLGGGTGVCLGIGAGLCVGAGLGVGRGGLFLLRR